MAETTEIQELNLDQKVTIRSIAGWTTGFARKYDGIGDVTIPPGGSARLTRNEIIAQVQSGNKLLAGIDGRGSHATLIIEDEPTRIEVEFDSEDGKVKQNVYSEEKVKAMFALKNQKNFESKIRDSIVTRAEKYAIISTTKKLGLNDYGKIRFIEEYTGYKLQ